MSRRQENSRMKSSYVTSRDRPNDLGHDSYLTSRSGARGQQPLRSRRSFSPLHTSEGIRRATRRDRRSSSRERRREYEQHVGQVHDDHVLSGSPLNEHVQKRPHLDKRDFDMSPTAKEIRGKYEYHKYLDYNNMNSRSKYPISFDECFEIGDEEDYIERRSGGSGHRTLGKNSMPIEDAMDREVQLRPNYGFGSKYGEASESYATVGVHRFKDENTRYQDEIPHEKLSKDMYYKDGEEYAYYSRGSPYIETSSQRKDFEGEDLLKCIPGTSSNLTVGREYSSKARDVRTLPSDELPKSYMRGIEPQVSDDYDQRTVSYPRRSYEPGAMDAKCYTCDAYTYDRAEHKGNYPEIGLRLIDEPDKHHTRAEHKGNYPEIGFRLIDEPDKHHTRAEHRDNYPEIGLRLTDDPNYTRRGSLYEEMTYAHGEHDRSLVGPGIMDATVETISKVEDSHFSRRAIKNSGGQELQNVKAQGYTDMRRSSNALKQAGNYLAYGYSHDELINKVPNHHHASEFSGKREHEIEDPRLGYGYGRYAPARSDRTRMKKSPEWKNYMELQRVRRSEGMKAEETLVYEKGLKRKYSMDEDMSRVDSRSVIPSKIYTATGTRDFDDYQVDWTSRKSSAGHSNRHSGYEQDQYSIEDGKIFEEIYHHKENSNATWTSYQNQSDSIQEDSRKPFKTGSRHFRGYAKSESSKNYSHVHHSHQRSNYYNQHNLRQRNEGDNHMKIHEEDIELPEDTSGLWKGEPSEESEAFKQRVQAAFLDFSKRFNENPTARKLYKEQGKAGSLFCVVCRRSASKEFLDTRALASHAFMSRKCGLRAQHLGLHKAICVLMGWNNMPDRDSGTWIPEALTQAETLVQKEDLILWPPLVIVHNISLSSNDHNEWKLINIEALGDFLREKGFSLGKMKICLGNPGDHSVILVKFLSTFSGLQEAERLHKYFLDRKHGRVDFEQAFSSIGKIGEGSNEVEQLEDVLLYGYMGVSDDLDKIDFDTKKKCSVKSKNEIHDLADAPVKPE